jgi:hypothetical protein
MELTWSGISLTVILVGEKVADPAGMGPAPATIVTPFELLFAFHCTLMV